MGRQRLLAVSKVAVPLLVGKRLLQPLRPRTGKSLKPAGSATDTTRKLEAAPAPR